MATHRLMSHDIDNPPTPPLWQRGGGDLKVIYVIKKE